MDEEGAHGGLGTPGQAGDKLSVKLRGLKPSDHIPLIGDDLGLPDEDDAHHAHSDDADTDHEAPQSFAGWLIKTASKPRHSRILLVLGTVPFPRD